jgi:hypothetical protein
MKKLDIGDGIAILRKGQYRRHAMVTAKIAKKPYLEISKSLHDQLAKTGKKTVKISIHQNGRKNQGAQKTTSLKRQLEFAEKTLGIWADDPKIEQAFKELEERWQQWREETLL